MINNKILTIINYISNFSICTVRRVLAPGLHLNCLLSVRILLIKLDSPFRCLIIVLFVCSRADREQEVEEEGPEKEEELEEEGRNQKNEKFSKCSAEIVRMNYVRTRVRLI